MTPRAVPWPAVARAPVLQWVRTRAPSGTRAAPARPMARVISRSALKSATAEINRSEEHTSELQSRVDLVCRLLREKKKISAPVPGAVPGLLQSLLQFFHVADVAIAARLHLVAIAERRESDEQRAQEPAEPIAFPFA